MSFHLYTKSVPAWDAMFARIQKAKTAIYIEMYIFTADTSDTHDFISLLKEKASAGVQVILILDALGSNDLPNTVIADVRAAGVEVRFFRYILHRMHPKLIIIDGTIAFVGGVNITGHARAWHDLHMELSGPIVYRLLRIFARTYKYAGGKQTLILSPVRKQTGKKMRMWLLEHAPHAKRKHMKRYYLNKLEHAKSEITFVTPYFVPSRWLTSAIREAISRGITVTVLVPSSTDFMLLNSINRYYAGKVSALGAQVFIMPAMNHAKALLIDDTEGLIGSGNIDSQSFSLNNELGVFFTDPIMIKQLKDAITVWKTQCALYNIQKHRLRWYECLMIPIIKLLHPVL